MTIAELEARLRIIEDLEAIKTFHRRYIFSLNNCQWDNIVECFTNDASVDIHGTYQGREEIRKHFTENISKLNSSGKVRDAHFAVEPVIEVDGDKARGHWLVYILISDPETGAASRWIGGRHDCEYSKVKGEWKFSSLAFTNPWPPES